MFILIMLGVVAASIAVLMGFGACFYTWGNKQLAQKRRGHHL